MRANAPYVSVYGVSFSYGSHAVLEEISFEIVSGEILALLGPNACGKSTLLKLMAGLMPLQPAGAGGQIQYRGTHLNSFSFQERAKWIAYVPPEFRAEFPLTVREAVTLGRGSHFSADHSRDRSAIDAAMEVCQVWDLRDRDLHTLSGGEKQRVMLARVIAQDPKVILLDEALSKMDLNHQAEMGRVLTRLAAAGKAIVIVSHDVNLATEWAKTALLMKSGKAIAYGPLNEVLTNTNIRTLYPSSDLTVGPSPTTGLPKVFFDHQSV